MKQTPKVVKDWFLALTIKKFAFKLDNNSSNCYYSKKLKASMTVLPTQIKVVFGDGDEYIDNRGSFFEADFEGTSHRDKFIEWVEQELGIKGWGSVGVYYLKKGETSMGVAGGSVSVNFGREYEL